MPCNQTRLAPKQPNIQMPLYFSRISCELCLLQIRLGRKGSLEPAAGNGPVSGTPAAPGTSGLLRVGYNGQMGQLRSMTRRMLFYSPLHLPQTSLLQDPDKTSAGMTEYFIHNPKGCEDAGFLPTLRLQCLGLLRLAM